MTAPQPSYPTSPQAAPSGPPAQRSGEPAAPAGPVSGAGPSGGEGAVGLPTINLPQGGGAVRGLGEKFAANPVTGTGSLSVPLHLSKGRAGFGPNLSLSYDSGRGNGPFGLGWGLSLPAVSRRTDKGLPEYTDDDVFLMTGTEDLVPVPNPVPSGDYPAGYTVDRFRPRIEGAFSRIERWRRAADGDVHWRSITRDGVTTVYGGDGGSRVEHDGLVWSWLISSAHDQHGNAVEYEYLPEDGRGVDLSSAHEQHRTAADRGAQRHLKRIRYGNRVSLLSTSERPQSWLFEAVFDYGDHDPARPLPTPDRDWPVRPDPFSVYRPGFEVRTHRLCRRVLMFHHFPDEPGVGMDCLVKATEFGYTADEAAGSFLASATTRGYRRDGEGYIERAMPPVEFGYRPATLRGEVGEVDADSLRNLPAGLGTTGCRWVDLDGEGLAGMLLDAPGGLYYKANLGGGRFDTARALPAVPNQTGTTLVDLAGDGQLDLVSYSGPLPGFVERADDGWAPFRPFAALPAIDWRDPNLRFADLDGDGFPDLLLAGDTGLTWYASRAEEGFGPARHVLNPPDEADGPRLLFTEGRAAVHLADMTGDGLLDLVRVRNGEVCYWPNLGRRFGRRVVTDNAPRYATEELFDPRRVLFADVDGSGVTDLVYAGAREVTLYRNRSGNGWTDGEVLTATPQGELTVADLLGAGTACLVWSATLPGRERRCLHYLDLYGGGKPHLLTEVVNNLGSRITVDYAPSTRHYLADKAAGRPWHTRLPFPVHVVDTVTTEDLVAGSVFTTSYAYHHGFFDGAEREFRGFGMVEQWDGGRIGAVAGDLLAGPRTLTRTWYHTGAFADGGETLSARYATEYWPGDPEFRLPDTVWPDGDLDPDDLREACRALKGLILRQEVYAEDSPLPYTVTERDYAVDLLRPKGGNAHAVCFARPRETLQLHYERREYAVEAGGVITTVMDPRISHELVLDADDFGNVLLSATVGYGRRHPDADVDPMLDAATRDAIRVAQTGVRVKVTASTFTNPVRTAAAFRAPQPAEVRTYELVNVTPPPGAPFALADLKAQVLTAAEVSYEQPPVAGPCRRLLEHTRVRYRRDDLTGPLGPGVQEPLGLPYESYRLAFTPGLLERAYRRGTQNLLPSPALVLGVEGGHVYADGGWWIPSGRLLYSPGAADTPAQELAYAREHFFTVTRHVDAFGAVGHAGYDGYDLLLLDTVDAVGNRLSAGERAKAATPDAEALTPRLDYRVLAPAVTSDANRNRTEVLYDALGLVTATARRGKPEEAVGDTLAGLDPEPDAAAYLADPLGQAGLLGGATSRFVIDVGAFHRTRDDARPAPVATALLRRETHGTEPGRVLHRITYSDGFNREIQVKAQAEPGPDGPRWVGSGWTVFDDKGRPVRRYEPFFTGSAAFELAYTAGVSNVVAYDPVGREVVLLAPDGTYSKTRFDPWQHEVWDPNDTVLLDPRTDPDVSALLAAHFAAQPAGWQTWHQRRIGGGLGPREQRAAIEAAVHAATPGAGYADVLGRTVVTVAHDRHTTPGTGVVVDERHAVRDVLDVEGARLSRTDARGVTTAETVFDVAGRAIATRSPDSGEHWYVPDVGGAPIRRWDSRGFAARHVYDAARRPAQLWITAPGSDTEILAALTVYGEGAPAAAADNVRGRVRYTFDGSGLLTAHRHDFKGNLLASRRQLAKAYDTTPDWSALAGVAPAGVETAALPLIEAEPMATATDYDALDRPVMQVLPEGTVLQPRYNEAGLLESLSARLSGAVAPTVYLASADYDAAGRRVRAAYGNGTVTEHRFDPHTFRLRGVATRRGTSALQDLSYVHDPSGNTVDAADAAQRTVFFDGEVTSGDSHYVFDSLYRLIEATGREHASLGVQPDGANPASRPIPHPDDVNAVRAYTQRYAYDPAGNILTMAHVAGVGSWTRNYLYATGSNRLLSHTVPGGAGSVSFTHDAHGNLTGLPHLGAIGFDHHDQMASVDLGGGGHAYYTYDGAGLRVRRMLRRNGGVTEEFVYLGGYEVYRRRVNGQVVFERQTVHLLDGPRRVATVERTTVDTWQPQQAGMLRHRFQYDDQTGSARLELDDTGKVISVEEYHPYGTTSLWLNAPEVSARRYRYTGKERDDETGLSYHGARYYVPWLGRWNSYDPQAHRPGESTYMYVRGNPVRFHDPDGADCKEMTEQKLPWWSFLFPAHAGYAVRPQLNPCLKDNPGWQQWEAESQKKMTTAATSGQVVGFGVASGFAAVGSVAVVSLVYGGIALGSMALTASESAGFWLLANPGKAAVMSVLAQFAVGLVDPHPVGMSPMDQNPLMAAGHATGAEVRTLAQVSGAEDLVVRTVRMLKPKQLMDALRETWALDKEAFGAMWRGTILEGVLAGTRYRLLEWVGRLKGGYFKTFDFYAKEGKIGIQLKTLQGVPKLSDYTKFIDELAAAKKAGVMEDGRAVSTVILDIATPAGYTGPAGKAAEYAANIKAIEKYGADNGVVVRVIGLTEDQLTNVVVSPKK
ncbi:SpvB/TcaC N-terminal domain-containing protein [Catellatospora sp. NPDC049133]|uniref:SpvB/TcaC N-terminal domain-containing protein n=1 Tax=Catellatospora sp. NPDC049133 TaxID=3155499 RepID=UPI0034073429